MNMMDEREKERYTNEVNRLFEELVSLMVRQSPATNQEYVDYIDCQYWPWSEDKKAPIRLTDTHIEDYQEYPHKFYEFITKHIYPKYRYKVNKIIKILNELKEINPVLFKECEWQAHDLMDYMLSDKGHKEFLEEQMWS